MTIVRLCKCPNGNCINAALSGCARYGFFLLRHLEHCAEIDAGCHRENSTTEKNVSSILLGILNRQGTAAAGTTSHTSASLRWRRTVFSQLRLTKEMFALLVVTLEEGMRRFDQFKHDYNYSGTSNFNTDKPECYASLTDNFAWDQSVDAHGGWAQAPNRQPAQQSECPAMGLSIPHDFFTS